MNTVFIGDFESRRDVAREFDVKMPHAVNKSRWGCDDKNDFDFPASIELLLAAYEPGDYCGSAFVLFVENDKLYEVNGNHCSCFGLEEQWEPEETSALALAQRIRDGDLGQLDGDSGVENWSGKLLAILVEYQQGIDRPKGIQ